MALLTRTEMCAFHGPHVETVEMESFEQASVVVLLFLTEQAPYTELVSLVSEWLSHDGSESFDIEFEDADYGNTMVYTYAV